MNKELKQILRAAKKQGWTVNQGRRNTHFRLVPPDPTISAYVLSHSPSCRRAVQNAKSDLRKLGLDI